jgi:xanthine dehydrogenase accessory factor
MNDEFLSELAKLKETVIPCVVVTLVHIKGSSPQEIGARIIVGNSGLLFGTVGGGKVETKAIAAAKELLFSEESHQFAEWNLQTDVGMTCGGVVSFYFEKILPVSNWKIAVFGAGHVAQELVRLLVKLDCEITCIDPRNEWLDKLPEHNRIKKIQTEDMKSVLKTLAPTTFITSMTMGHAFDLPILLEAMTKFEFPYLGVIGSEAKAKVLKAELKASGVSELKIAKLICPIGEDFGNNSPVEIALSIVVQLIKLRNL